MIEKVNEMCEEDTLNLADKNCKWCMAKYDDIWFRYSIVKECSNFFNF